MPLQRDNVKELGEKERELRCLWWDPQFRFHQVRLSMSVLASCTLLAAGKLPLGGVHSDYPLNGSCDMLYISGTAESGLEIDAVCCQRLLL